jgi:homoserine dehydrogenase
MRILNIGLIGCGTVGRGVANLIASRGAAIEKRYGVRLKLVHIVNRSHVKLSPSVRRRLNARISHDPKGIWSDGSIDVVVELIGGTTVARRIITHALRQGKHVVTANKALIASHGAELFKIAQKHDRQIFFEASVAGGIPIIKVLSEGLAANHVDSVSAILNGTSNYILTEMSQKGQGFQEALKLAQAHGYAEKNPFLDVSGNDTRHKLAILATLAFNQHIDVKDILCEGISNVQEMDIQVAWEMGYTIKPVAIARVVQNKLDIRVHPALLSENHLLSNVHGVYNAVVVNGDRVGETVYTGQGAGQNPTASSVVADLIDCGLGSTRSLVVQRAFLTRRSIRIRTLSGIEAEYYLRFNVKDQPGVLAAISGILGRYSISVAQMLQKGHGQRGSVPLVMLTHRARERDVKQAMKKINCLSIVKGAGIILRVEG